MNEEFVQDLIDKARRTPYSHLKGYMNRYWVNPPVPDANGKWGKATRLHEILRSDLDPHMHDHPWDYKSTILRGHYIEERRVLGLDGFYKIEKRDCLPGSVLQRKAQDVHKLTLPDGPVWTLFETGEYRQPWGFITESGKVYWKTYLALQAAKERESNNPFTGMA